MRKIDSYYYYVSKIRTNIYETKEGLKVIESVNKNTVEYDFSIVVNGGTYFEDILNVHQGTAHLLEHLIFGNPNSFLKTKNALSEYKMGSKKRASFYSNASTTHLFLYFFAHGHENAKLRILKFITSQVLFPEKNISKYLEKERSIVIAEKNQRKKDEKWSWLQYMKKVFGEEFKNFRRDVLGEIESIEAITKDDILKYYQHIFRADNMAVAVQTSKPLSTTEKKVIRDLSVALKPKKPEKPNKTPKNFIPKYANHTFKNENARDIFMSINYFYTLKFDLETEEDYLNDRLYLFLTDLINKVSYDYIREQKHLTYSISGINENVLFNTKNRGITLSFSFENFEEVLDSLYEMIYVEFEKFLMSKRGKRWLNNILSYYIYKTNQKHDPDYAEYIAVEVLDNKFSKFDYRIAKKAAKSITPEKLLDFAKKFFEIEPIFWINSPYEDEEILKVFENHKFHKKFKSR